MRSMLVHSSAQHRRRGMTMIEAVVGSLLISTMFVASMQALSTASIVRFTTAERARGQALASALMGEILQQDYSAPATPKSGVTILGVITLSGGSTGTPSGSNRLNFDDVDDYHNYSDSPPTSRDGIIITGANGFARNVSVVKVNPTDLTVISATETGAKRITVTVTRNGRTVARRVAVRTSAP